MNLLDKVYCKERCKKLSLSQMDELKADITNKVRVCEILKNMALQNQPITGIRNSLEDKKLITQDYLHIANSHYIL